jgi:hypothetical protein
MLPKNLPAMLAGVEPFELPSKNKTGNITVRFRPEVQAEITEMANRLQMSRGAAAGLLVEIGLHEVHRAAQKK